MGVSIDVGSFATATGTGNQAVAGVGFVPKAMLFSLNERTADGTEADGVIALGMTDGTNDASVCNTIKTSSSTERARHNNTDCISMINPDATLLREGSLSSFDADGFTLNWGTVNAAAHVCNYWAIGGADVTNSFRKEISTPGGTGNTAYTGVGFQPDVVIAMSAGITTAPPANTTKAKLMLGFATSSTSRRVMSFQKESSTSRTEMRDDELLVVKDDSGNVVVADLVSMDADGFTLNYSLTTISSVEVWFLCLKFASGTVVTLDTFSQSTATGSQKVYTAEESRAILLLSAGVGLNTESQSDSEILVGFGQDDGTTIADDCVCMAYKAAFTNTGRQGIDQNDIIFQHDSAGTTLANANLVGSDEVCIDLNYATANANGDTAFVMAIADDTDSGSDGPNLPAAGVNDASVGTTAWTDPGNITASDDTRATVKPASGSSSQYLKADDFGLTIPSGATITGIEVEWERSESFLSGDYTDSSIRLVKGGTIQGDEKSLASTWSDSEAFIKYGGPCDLWGLAWLDTDFGSNFGAVNSVAKSGGSNAVAQLDSVRVTVYYFEGGGGGGGGSLLGQLGTLGVGQ